MMLLPGGLQWAHPSAWAVALVPLGLAWRRRHERAIVPSGYAEPRMAAWVLRDDRRRGRGVAVLGEMLLWLLLAAALAGPRQPVQRDASAASGARHATALLVLLQLPAAADPARLQAARMALRDLQSRLHGECLGLLVYDQATGLLLPCTSDPMLFDAALGRADPRLLAGLPGPGLAGALALARRELLREPAPSRAVLLLAQTAARAQPQLRRQAGALRAAGIPLYLAWNGAGRPAAELAALVAATSGRQARVGRPALWSTLYERGIARLPGGAPAPAAVAAWRELYGLPLLGALLLLLVSRGGPWKRRADAGGAGLLLAIAVAGAGLNPVPAHAQSAAPRWQAWQAWQHARYPECADAYARLRGFDARMGEGACAYRAGRFSVARASFRRAMLDASTDRDRALALYDLGNACLELPGRLREALDAYRASLVLLPARAQTLRNLRLARALWAQRHPEYELAGMRKRGPPGKVAFGDTSNTAPSQLRHRRRQRAGFDADQRLRVGGELREAGAVPAGAGASIVVSAADARAASRGMLLLHDHAARLLRGLIRHDSREAAELVGQR